METQVNTTAAVTPRSIGIKWGLIAALINVVFFLGLAVSGQNAFDNVWGWIRLVISVVIIFLAHKNYKESGDGFMSYGQGVGIAFWIALISLIINFIVTYVYVSFIDPGAMQLFYDTQAEQMSEKGMQDEQIEMAMNFTKMLFWPIYLFFGLLFGVIMGLIVSIFTQKKNPEPVF
jgi:Protein of unknown function (DUF4199)